MPAPLPLFALDAQITAFEADLIENGGVIDEETEASYHALLDARDDKAAACLAVIRRNLATADAFTAEAKRLADLAKTHSNTAERVKRMLLGSMLLHGETKHETAIGRAAVQYASQRAVLVNVEVEDIPERFLTPPAAPTVDKRALGAALKDEDPEALSVASLAPPTPFLRIS